MSSIRLASSYCTNHGCHEHVISESTRAVNGFSTTSYYVALDGHLTPCGPEYGACNWTSAFGDPDEFNSAVRRATGAVAQPLAFSNSGDMVQAFRALVAAPSGIDSAAAFLSDRAARYNYTRMQLDLEPSCWAGDASECEWPTSDDADNYVRFINATADALAPVGAGVAVAVGNWPGGKCTPLNYTSCVAAGDNYTARCRAGEWSVGSCNCCAYVTFFALEQICASRAATIVNMDTYQDAPFEPQAFHDAMHWYLEHGCAPEKMAIGLLTGEATDAAGAAEVLNAVGRYPGVVELDIWANIWAQPAALATWVAPLEGFLDGPSPTSHRFPAWLGFVLSGCVAGMLLVLILELCRRRGVGREERGDMAAALLR